MAFDLDRNLRQYDEFTEAFIDTFSGFDKATFDRPRAAGKWSPGQLVEHLLACERGTLRLVNGPTEVREGRAADAEIERLTQVLLTPGNRLEAMPGLHPVADRHNRVEMLDALVDSRADVRVAIEFAEELAAVPTGWSHPVFGELTLLEWLTFTALHGERHRRQFE